MNGLKNILFFWGCFFIGVLSNIFKSKEKSLYNHNRKLFNHAVSLSKAGKYEESLNILNELLEIDFERIHVLMSLYFIYKMLEDYEKSLEYIDSLLELTEGTSVDLINKAEILIHLKKYDQSLICLDKLLNGSDMINHAKLIKTNVLIELGDNEKAESILSTVKFTKDETLDPDLWLSKGNNFAYLNRFNDAVYCFNKCINLGSTSYDLYYNLGICYTKLDECDAALECFDEALKLDVNSNILYNKSHFLYELKRFDEIINLANIMIDLDSSFANAYDVKSSAYVAKSDWKNALNCVNQALDLKPKEELYIERKKYIINKMDDL